MPVVLYSNAGQVDRRRLVNLRLSSCRPALLILMVSTSIVNSGLITASFVDSYKFKNEHPGRCHIWLSTKWVHRPECWFDGYARINKWRHSKLEKQQMVRRDIWTTSTNLPINKMGQPHILLFLAPYHFSCCPENTKWGAPTVSTQQRKVIQIQAGWSEEKNVFNIFNSAA